MSERQENHTSGDVDIVDMIVVLIRYRKFIVLSILISLALVVVGYFFIPKWQAKTSEPSEEIYSQMVVMPNPHFQHFQIVRDIPILLSQPDLLLKAFIATGIDVKDPAKKIDWATQKEYHRTGALALIKKWVIVSDKDKNPKRGEKKWVFYVHFDRKKSKNVKITYIQKGTDNGAAVAFLENLFRLANKRLTDSILMPNANATILAFNELTAAFQEADSSALIPYGLKDYSKAKGIANGTIQALVKSGGPYYFPRVQKNASKLKKLKAKYLKNSLVFFWIPFCCFVIIIAYIFEVIHHIRKDEKKMLKLKNAFDARE